MKIILIACLFLLLLACGNTTTITNTQPPYHSPSPSPSPTSQPFEHMPAEFVRGVWVTTAWQLDFPARTGMTASQLQAQIDGMADNMLAWEITDILFQARSMGDAFYPSDYFPWSALLSGTQGVAPHEAFDVLQAWIDAAHSRNMRLHVWVNPYRLGTENMLAEQHPELIVSHSGILYFCPGNPQSLEIILAGIDEIARNYNIDGIHFDDRFYPGREFNDTVSFERYGGDLTLDDWRRENVNRLIRETQAIARYHNVMFGVSPFAIWQNDTTHPNGSATSGNESYHAMYADTLAWVQRGYIDYIAPQIYWHRGHEAACWDAVLDWWVAVTQDTYVHLYIGIAVYRQFDADRFPQWQEADTLNMQRDVTHNHDDIDGVIFFRYMQMSLWLDE